MNEWRTEGGTKPKKANSQRAVSLRFLRSQSWEVVPFFNEMI